MMEFSSRVFSGIQPSGHLHLGNYLGAIMRFVALQDHHECIYCVVDMHALTIWQDPDILRQRTHEIAAGYLAAGIDPTHSIIFNQSQVGEHAELAWIFNCVARMGWLSRMTQFKDKAGKNRENASTGLFVYPNLMAADILLYKATHVPVGEDQKQHLELTRDIAQKFNIDFAPQIAGRGHGEQFFPLTEPLIDGPTPRVMSLRDGTKKMSSSDPSDMARINLTDDAETISRKIRKAKTDPEPLPDNIEALKERPEAKNLVSIFAALNAQDEASVITEFAGRPFSNFKPVFADLAIAKIAPIADEMQHLMAAPDHIDQILRNGAKRARAIAEPIINEVKDIVGLIR